MIGKASKQPVEKKKVKSKSAEAKPANAVASSTLFSNPQLFVDEILDKTSALILSEVSTTSICYFFDALNDTIQDLDFMYSLFI